MRETSGVSSSESSESVKLTEVTEATDALLEDRLDDLFEDRTDIFEFCLSKD